MDDTGSAPNTADASGQPPVEHTAPIAGAPGSKMARTRSIPTSTLVLGAILLVVVAFLGGWVGGHHAARQADRMAFGSFMRQRENGSGPGYGMGSGGYGSGYDPRYAPGTGSWCAPCYGSTNGVAVPCSSGMPGFSPGGTGSGQTVPPAVPGTGGSQGSGS